MSFGQSAELLARIQFAFTVSFHFIFPAFSIGLASYLAVLNGLWLWTKDAAYLKLFDYWKTVFAITFGMGVVSGIVMSYQFGTNWAAFSDKAGPVIGPLMGYEVLTAFFLEAGFLGIALFGRKRVGNGLHMFAVAMVAIGTLISATWILAANSWMQTPAGYAHQRRRPVHPARLVGDHLQPELPLSAGPHGAGGVPDHGLRGRRGGRLPSAARQHQPPGANDVLDGDVDGGAGDAGADLRRRPARAQHARAPAGQDRGDGGTLRDAQGRAADPVRHPRRRGGDDAFCGRDPQARLAHPRALVGRRDQGAEGLPARRAAAGLPAVLDLPHHGRARHPDAGGRRCGRCGRGSARRSTRANGCIARRC